MVLSREIELIIRPPTQTVVLLSFLLSIVRSVKRVSVVVGSEENATVVSESEGTITPKKKEGLQKEQPLAFTFTACTI